jgi:hypothetical protein
MKTRVIFGQPSWRIAAKSVEAFVTRKGGQLAPVTFKIKGRRIEPFAVAPWATEKVDRSVPAIVRILRGDFFCMPFGGNATPYRGEHHPLHGETANATWTLQDAQPGHLHLSLRTKVRPGRVDKHIFLRNGQNIVYQRHVISGMAGPMSFGHHAMLRFPDETGSGLISTSRFVYGQVYPDWFERPENRGYQALKPGAEFTTLSAVPMLNGQTTDVSRYPARRGFEDLVGLVADPRLTLGWTAVAFPKHRYVWFALRDPRVLTGTLFWITNGGRHYPPWNGRHVNVMGLEDVTTYYGPGLAESVGENPLTRRGYATCAQLDPATPFVVNYIFGVAAIPAGFDHVAHLEPAECAVEMRSRSGKVVHARVDTEFLYQTKGNSM